MMSQEKEASYSEAEEKSGGYTAENIYESTSDFWGGTDSSSESTQTSTESGARDTSGETAGHRSGKEG